MKSQITVKHLELLYREAGVIHSLTLVAFTHAFAVAIV